MQRQNKVVGFHYREKSEVQGAWKEFDSVSDAVAWTNYRKRKTANSPQGAFVTDDLDAIRDLSTCDEIGLAKAAAAYLRYKKLLQ